MKKDLRIQVCVTAEELAKIKAAASKLGLPLSIYMRLKAFEAIEASCVEPAK